jgi:CRISPR-associated exonuclease Cas4
MGADSAIAPESGFTEDDLLPLSGLQHLVYCPRQFALIHIEQEWAENLYTAEGQMLHRRADSGRSESRGSLHIARSLRLRSLRLGVSGIADVVEFNRSQQGIVLPGREDHWQPFPVEYKRGRPKKGDMDEVQLCAQALCLEEMLGAEIPEGALFYGKARRRKVVSFTSTLRDRVEDLCRHMHRLYREGRTPAAEPGLKCEHCSLRQRCLPESTDGGKALVGYLAEIFKEQG